MKDLNAMIRQIKQQIIEQYKKGYTIVLFTSKDTILLKQAYTSDKALNEILNTGLYRHNRVIHGRILKC